MNYVNVIDLPCYTNDFIYVASTRFGQTTYYRMRAGWSPLLMVGEESRYEGDMVRLSYGSTAYDIFRNLIKLCEPDNLSVRLSASLKVDGADGLSRLARCIDEADYIFPYSSESLVDVYGVQRNE